MGRIVSSIFGGGQSSSTPDPYAVAAAQGIANTEAARTTAALNRANQYTPWGNQTWSQGGNWDSAGYQKALDAYNQQVSQPQTSASQTGGTPSVWVDNHGIEHRDYSNMTGGTTTAQPVAPDKSTYGYNPDAWSSTVTLSPAQQALLDQQNKISQGLGSAQEAALGRVRSTFGSGLDTTNITGRQGVADSLSAAGQGLYDPSKLYTGAQGLANTAGQIANQAASNYSNILSSKMPAVERTSALPVYQRQSGSVPTSNEAYRQQIQDALYKQQQSRLDPRFAQAESDQAAALAAQGIMQGSEAYNREVQNLGQTKNDAYQSAMNQAITGGEAAIQGQYGRDLAGRQQGVSEENDAYQASLAGRSSDLAALNQYYNQSLANRQQGMQEYNTALAGGLAGQGTLQNAAQVGQQQISALPQTAQAYQNLYNNQRTSELGEQQTVRNQILNELNALRSGAQVTTPTFGATSTGASVSAAPVASNVWNSYNAQQAQNTSSMNGLLGLGQLGLAAYTGGLFS